MAKKKFSKEYLLRERMYHYRKNHPGLSKKEVVLHFVEEGVPKSTIYSILERIGKKLPPERKARVTPYPCKMTREKVNLLKNMIDHHDGISQIHLGCQFHVHQSTICRTIKNKTSIRYLKKRKAPKRTSRQIQVSRPKCTKLTKILRKREVIIDDESYFGLSNFVLSGNTGFYSSDVQATPKEIKLKRVEKFPPKLLVWIALSSKGISRHYIVPRRQSINEDIYINKCLRLRLIPFIQEFHQNDEIVFWPDLASSHYSTKVQEFLEGQNIEFVPKERNVANLPELRPIEDFWSYLKREVYHKCWQAENLEQLRRRIEYCIKKLDPDLIHRLGRASFTRVDKARRVGIENL